MTERTVLVYAPPGSPVRERQVSVPWCMTCDEPLTLTRSEHVVTDDCDVRDGVVWRTVDGDE